jgi:hypothetical protein
MTGEFPLEQPHDLLKRRRVVLSLATDGNGGVGGWW